MSLFFVALSQLFMVKRTCYTNINFLNKLLKLCESEVNCINPENHLNTKQVLKGHFSQTPKSYFQQNMGVSILI